MAQTAVRQTTLRACEAIGCADFAPDGWLFCDRHDAMLQSDIKGILRRKYKPGRKPMKVFSVVLERAKQEVLFCQTAGYRTPRDAEFEW